MERYHRTTDYNTNPGEEEEGDVMPTQELKTKGFVIPSGGFTFQGLKCVSTGVGYSTVIDYSSELIKVNY